MATKWDLLIDFYINSNASLFHGLHKTYIAILMPRLNLYTYKSLVIKCVSMAFNCAPSPESGQLATWHQNTPDPKWLISKSKNSLKQWAEPKKFHRDANLLSDIF